MLTTYSIRTTRYIVLPVHIYKCDKYSSLKSIWNVFYIISQCQLRIYFLKNGLILSAWFRVPSNVCSICDGVCVCVCVRFTYTIFYCHRLSLDKLLLEILTTCDKIWTINSNGNCRWWLLCKHAYVVRCLWYRCLQPSFSFDALFFIMPTWNMNFIYSLDRYIEVIIRAWNKLSPDYFIGWRWP